MIEISLFCLSILFGFFLLTRSEILNPYLIFSLPVGLGLLSCFLLSQFVSERPIAIDMEQTGRFYLFQVMGFFGGLLLGKAVSHSDASKIKSEDLNLVRFFSLGWSLLVWAGVGFACLKLGTFPLYDMVQGELDVRDLDIYLRQLPMGIMSIINLSVIMLMLTSSHVITNSNRFAFQNAFFVFTGIMGTVWAGKRQAILFFIFAYCASFILNTTFQIKKLVKLFLFLFVAFVVIFVVLDRIRYTDLGSSNYLSLLWYAAYPAANIDSIISVCASGQCSFDGSFTFSEMMPSRLGGKAQFGQLSQILYEPTSPFGQGGLVFIDFGLRGVVLVCFIFGLLVAWTYNNRMKSSFVQMLSILMLWYCGTFYIYAHLFSLNYFLLPVGAVIIQWVISQLLKGHVVS